MQHVIEPLGPPWEDDPTYKHSTAGVHSHAYFSDTDDLQHRLDNATGRGVDVWIPGSEVPPVGGGA